MAFLAVLVAVSVAAAPDPGWLPVQTAAAQQQSMDLRADVRGVAIEFSWNEVGGATNYLLATSGSEMQFGSDITSYVIPISGTPGDRQTYTIKATDRNDQPANGGRVLASDSVTITVPTNRAPVVDAGRNATAASATEITLRGSASDPNRDTLTYTWSQVSGPAVSLPYAEGTSVAFAAPVVASGSRTLVFSLTASDGRLSSSDIVGITVENSRPDADAGEDQVVTNGTRVTLDAGGSADPDGPLTYLWEQTGGTGVDFGNSTQRTTFTAPAAASNLVFRLTVNDTQYADSDTVAVRVVENRPPTARISIPDITAAGQRVMLNGSDSSDPDGDRLTYRWTQTAGDTVSLSGGSSPIASFTVPHVDEDRYAGAEFRLAVSDGAFTASRTVAVYFAENGPPLAYASGHVASEYEDLLVGGDRIPAGADYSTPRGVVFVLNGSESLDPDGDALTYRWKQTDGPGVRLSGANTAAASFNTEISAYAVLLEFELAVRDIAGNADTVSLTVAVEGILYPAADAGRDVEVRPGSRVTLDGSGSTDPAGEELTYRWTQTEGDGVALSGAGGASPSFTAPPATNATKTLTFRLEVEAGTTTDTDTVSVHVVPQSVKPIANAGSSERVDGGANVTLDGSGSTGEGTLSYNWRQTTGTRVTLDGADTASPSFVAPNTTRYTVMGFTLTVRDSGGNGDADTVRVTVGHNAAPSADAGRDVNAFAGSRVTLSGSGSDPERGSLTYSWTQTGGAGVVLSNPSSARPTFTAPDSAGTLSFTLVVRDRQGNSGSDRVDVTVFARGAQATLPGVVADAGPDQTVAAGSTVRLDGGSSTGPGLSYTWARTGGPSVTLSNSTVASPTFTAPDSAATLTFRLTVASGGATDTDAVRVTVVSEANGPPSANAGGDATVRPGETVALSGSGSDPDGDGLSYRWTQTAGPGVEIADRDGARASFVAPDRTGTLTFRLTVTDTSGQAGTDTVTFTVESSVPVADAGPNQSVEPGVAVRLDGRSSYDPDGGSLSYSWTQTGGAAASLSGSGGPTPSFRSPSVEYDVLVFQLTVRDGGGNTGTDSVAVTVDAVEPAANAGPDQSVRGGQTVYLDGNNSVDGSGLPTYAWTQTGGARVTLSGADGKSPSFVAPSTGGTLTFKLTVSNGIYGSSDTVRITVDVNDSPTVNAGNDKSVKSGERVELRGSVTDPDSANLSYSWTVESGPAAHISNGNARTAYFSAPDVSGTQTMVIKFEVADGEGGSDSDTTTVTVRENSRPVAAVSVMDAHVAPGDRVTLDASGSYDPDGDGLTYRWAQDGGPAVSLSGSGARVSFTAPNVAGDAPDLESEIYISVEVSDGAKSDAVSFSVSVTNNAKPAVSVSQSSVRVASNSTFTLSGTLTDTDGDADAWWEQTSGPDVAYVGHSDDGRTVSRTDRAPVVESGTVTLTFAFKASDYDWAVSKTVTVTVYAG